MKEKRSVDIHSREVIMSRQGIRKFPDDYEVSDILGRGGFSVVRRGFSKSGANKTHVTVKTLRRFGLAPPGIQRAQSGQKGSTASAAMNMWKQASISDASLTNEILVMRKIVENVSPHPNVINLYDVYEDGSGVHLVLELLLRWGAGSSSTGLSLRHAIRSSKLQW